GAPAVSPWDLSRLLVALHRPHPQSLTPLVFVGRLRESRARPPLPGPPPLEMTATLFLALALSATNPPLPDSGRFTLYKLQHEVGGDTCPWVSTGRGRMLTTRWACRYLGTDVRLETTLETTEDGRPLHLRSHGQTSTLTDIDLDVRVEGARSFPIHRYPPLALEEALFRYWLARGRPRTLPLVPDGAAAFELRGSDTLAGPSGPVVAKRYSVTGLLWGRQSLWATDDGRLIAVVNGDAELDCFEGVRQGFESHLATFVRGAVRDGLADLAVQTRAVRPIHEGDYAITGALLVDGTGSLPVADAVIVIRDGRIAAAGARAGWPRRAARGYARTGARDGAALPRRRVPADQGLPVRPAGVGERDRGRGTPVGDDGDGTRSDRHERVPVRRGRRGSDQPHWL